MIQYFMYKFVLICGKIHFGRRIGVITVFKKTLKALGKILVSGIIAFIILTLFCCIYYNVPVHSANNDGSTDYKWEPNVFYSQGTEGFAWGKMNNDGFTNLFDYNDDTTVDVLVMGSSQMEARQVGMSQSTAGRLNTLLENDTVYNIGVSGHTFLTCASNLSSALNKYHPTKYVVIGTSSLSFSDEAITLAINEETPEIASNDEGFIGLLQKNPCLRLMYHQIKNYTKLQAGGTEELEDFETPVTTDTKTETDIATNEKLLADLLNKMSTLAEEHSVKVIIMHDPAINISSDGSINFSTTQNTTTKFQKLCNDNGILFLDMSARFKAEYETNHVLPYGFSNSPVGSGHLNKFGHAMISDELYNLILEED